MLTSLPRCVQRWPASGLLLTALTPYPARYVCRQLKAQLAKVHFSGAIYSCLEQQQRQCTLSITHLCRVGTAEVEWISAAARLHIQVQSTTKGLAGKWLLLQTSVIATWRSTCRMQPCCGWQQQHKPPVSLLRAASCVSTAPLLVHMAAD